MTHGDDWVHVRADEVPKSPISGELVFKGGWVINPRAETGGYKLHATSPDSEVYAMLRRFRKVVQEGGRACLTPEEAQLINRHYCLVTKAGDKINLFVTYDVAQKIKGVAPRGADRDKPRTHRRDSGHEYGVGGYKGKGSVSCGSKKLTKGRKRRQDAARARQEAAAKARADKMKAEAAAKAAARSA